MLPFSKTPFTLNSVIYFKLCDCEQTVTALHPFYLVYLEMLLLISELFFVSVSPKCYGTNLFITRFESTFFEDFLMSDEEAKGKVEKTKGKIREDLGKITGDKKEQVKGKVEQVKGKVQEEVGKAKRKAKE